jgi:hypothetical protein
MLHIDDNTFIDTSLITCSEYQLFLDEMRAQGKYFQPDHWPECHFPAGEARQPVLGMRPSDAIAFCEWLTARQPDKWQYRLPTLEEASAYPLPIGVADGLGYWAYNPSTKARVFIWASALRPKTLSQEFLQGRIEDALDLDLTLTLALDRTSAFRLASAHADAIRDDRHRARPLGHDRALALADELYLARDYVLDLDLDLTRDLDRDLTSDCDRAFDRDLASDRDRALDHIRARGLARALDRALDHIPALDRARDLDHALDRHRARARDLGRALASDLDRYLALASKFAREFDHGLGLALRDDFGPVLDLDRALARDLHLAHDRDLDRALARDLTSARASARDLANNLFVDQLLKQRVQGHLPAFEGIRIVKERKKGG